MQFIQFMKDVLYAVYAKKNSKSMEVDTKQFIQRLITIFKVFIIKF